MKKKYDCGGHMDVHSILSAFMRVLPEGIREGARKNGAPPVADTYIPNSKVLGEKDYERLATALPGIEF